MHPQETKNLFVELRAEGKSFGDISEQLGVPKPTLHRWSEEHADDILRFRRTEWEDLEATGHWRAEDLLLDLNSDIDDLEDHLRRFPVERLGLRDTIMLMREKRRERDRLRALLMGTGSRSKKSVSCVQSAVSPGEVKMERSRENGTTQPRNTNDLQQPNAEPFHFVTPSVAPAGTSSVDSQTSSQPIANEATSSAYAATESPNSSNPSVVPPESNKTERSAETSDTQQRNTNDLQQPKPESFDSITPGGASSVELNPPSHESHNSHTSHPPQPENIIFNSCELVVKPEIDERPWWEREPAPNER